MRSIAAGTAAIGVTCDIDCTIFARLERLPAHTTTLVARAAGKAGERTLAKFRKTRARARALPLHRSSDRAGEPGPAARARERPVDSPLDLFPSSDRAARVPAPVLQTASAGLSMRLLPVLIAAALRRARRCGARRRGTCLADQAAAADGRRSRGCRARAGVGADAKMALASLAGFDTIRITSIWSPGETGGRRHRAPLPPDRGRRGAAARDPRDRLGLPIRRTTTPVTATARAQFAVVRGVDPAPGAGRAVPDRRQRAEPEPLLDAAVHDAGGGDAAASSYLGLLAQTYDAIKAVAPGVTRDRRIALAARQRQPALVPADPLPDALHPRPRHRLSAERPHAPGDGLVRDPPVPRDTRRIPPTFAHPRSTTISLADYGKLRPAPRRSAFDGTRQRGSTLPIIYDEFGVQTKQPDDKRLIYANQNLPSASTPSTRRPRARYYRAGAPAGRVPAERGRTPLLPRHRRGRARPVAVRASTTPTTRRSRAFPLVRSAAGAARAGRWSRPAASLAFARGCGLACAAWTGPVRRLHVLPRRPGLAAAAGRGARRGEGRLRRGRRVLGGAHGRPADYTCTGVRPDCDFFLWKITERYDRPGRAGRGAERDPARRLARRPRSRTSRRPARPSTRARASRGRSRRTTSRTSSSTRS